MDDDDSTQAPSQHFGTGQSCECSPDACKVCFGIRWGVLSLEGEWPRYRHGFRTSLYGLMSSAGSGCLTCSILVEGLRCVLPDKVLLPHLESSLVEVGEEKETNPRLCLDVSKVAEIDWEMLRVEYFVRKRLAVACPAFESLKPSMTGFDLETCRNFALGNLKSCDEIHTACRPPPNLQRPRRLLRIVPVQRLLLKLEENVAESVPYTALSHCWGNPRDILTTTKLTLLQRLNGIEWGELPETFRDAVSFTRALGIHYIWIDSLCILQDDASDWRTESAKMADIYTGSYLTIAATSSYDCHGGIFQVGNITRHVVIEKEMAPLGFVEIKALGDTRGTGVYVKGVENYAHRDFSDLSAQMSTIERTFPHASPLHRRAWVLQERLLSTRTVHFHADELVWECKTMMNCQCKKVDEQRTGELREPYMGREDLIGKELQGSLKMRFTEICSTPASKTERQKSDFWLQLVTKYTQLRLSRESDRLPALSGMASRCSEHFGWQYLAGLWIEDLARGLCWEGGLCWGKVVRDPSNTTPSWSWASVQVRRESESTSTWKDGVSASNYNFHLVDPFHTDPRFKLVSINVATDAENVFGTVLGGVLTIEGAWVEPTVLFGDKEEPTPSASVALWRSHVNHRFPEIAALGHLALAAVDTTLEAQSPEMSLHGETVGCLLIGATQDPPESSQNFSWSSTRFRESRAKFTEHALLLRECANRSGCYQRFAIMHIAQDWDWFRGAPVERVKII